MADSYSRFLDFDWSDPKWQEYLAGLYPPPNARQLLRFKQKWYKKHIDPDFDDTYEPSSTSSSAPNQAASSSESASSPPASALPTAAFSDGSRWAIMGAKAAICFSSYAIAMTLAVGSFSGVFSPYQSLVVLVSAFILEILAKYSLKFTTEYMYAVLLDDVGVMPMMSLTLLTPGMQYEIRILALVPAFLTAALSFAQICKAYAKLPATVREFFTPLAETAARNKVMEWRAHAEVALGFALVIGVFGLRVAPISPLLYWNFMMLRYMMNAWTQASFKSLDARLETILGRIPIVSSGYAALKRSVYGFVDPNSRRAGKLCSIL